MASPGATITSADQRTELETGGGQQQRRPGHGALNLVDVAHSDDVAGCCASVDSGGTR